MKQSVYKNLTITAVEELFASMGEKPYRAHSSSTGLYEKNVDSFDDMSNFSKELRRALDERFE
jgi:23S rRNA (adenine2503-C2)-methyltransferase